MRLLNITTKIRNFVWQDFEPLVDVISAAWDNQHPDHPTNPAVLRGWLEQPGLHPQQNSSVAERDGRLAGYVFLTPETPTGRGVVGGGVHPEFRHQGIGRQLLHTAVSRAQDLSLTHVDVRIPKEAHAGRQLLTREGFVLVRVHWHMRWGDGSLDPPALPEGYAVRSFSPGDEAALTEIQNASFDGTWGFSSNTVEQIAYQVRFPDPQPEGILFLTHGQEVVGYNWTRIEGPAGRATGNICMTGVAPSHRGRGLGRVIVAAGMWFLQKHGSQSIELTVDRQNTPALKLYLSLGFQSYRESHWYQLRL